MSITRSCPSCGAPYAAYNPGLVTFVCEHCHSVFYLDEEKVLLAGQQSLLTEGFSRLYRGATGSFHQKRFRVLGRVRYGYPQGFWDEWFLELDDGGTAWLTEDMHELAVQESADIGRVGPPKSYRPGQKIDAAEAVFTVQEVGRAKCLGLEGALPTALKIGTSFDYVDATSVDGRYSLGLEFDGDPPSVYLGRWLKYQEIQLDEEGAEW